MRTFTASLTSLLRAAFAPGVEGMTPSKKRLAVLSGLSSALDARRVMRAAWVVVACACAQALVAPTSRAIRPRMRRCAAASPAHALAERPRRRLRRRLRRSAIGLGAGAGVVLLGGGRGSALYWSLLPALLPWTPAFDTARLVVLFMRAARVDILEQRFRVEATAFSDPPEALTHPRPPEPRRLRRLAAAAARPFAPAAPRPRPLRVLCMDGGGMRGVNLLCMLEALEARLGAPVHERFDLVCGTSIGGAGALFMAHLDRPLAEAREASDQMREACFVGASSWRLLVRGYAARRAPGEVVSARVGPDRPLLAPAARDAAPPAAARLDLPDTLGFASGRGRDALQAVRAARDALSARALAPLAVGYYDGSEPAAPPPTRAASPLRPRAFAVAARETEGGALEPFLFRTYEPPAGALASGRCDARLWEAVAATCAAPTFFAPVAIEGEAGADVYVDGGIVANDPTLLALSEVAALWPDRPVGVVVSLGCGQQKRRKREGRRRGKDRARARPRIARFRRADVDGLEDAAFTERLFRSLGLSWEHEPRIRRAARRALDKRGATYVRLEPPLDEAVSLAETDAAKIEAMKRGVADWVAAPEQARVLDDVARLLSEEQAGLAGALARSVSALDGAARGARGAVATLPDSVGRVTALFEPRKPEATRWPKATAFIRSR